MKILLCLLLPWLGVTGVPIPAHVSVLTGALPQGVKFWGGLSIPPHHLSRPSSPKSGGRDETSGSVGVIPAEWDSRAHEAFRVCWGSLSSVQEQGNCGASWAIVAGQQYRDSLCTSGGKNKTLPDAELSAFDALTCATSTAVAFGCGGAVLTAGFEFFKQEGVCQATCKAYPWQKQDQGPGKDEADTPKCVPMCDKPAPSGSGGAGAGGREAEYKREKAARVLTSYGTLGWGKDAADPAKVSPFPHVPRHRPAHVIREFAGEERGDAEGVCGERVCVLPQLWGVRWRRLLSK